MEWTEPAFWVAAWLTFTTQIILINIVLSGDNAVVGPCSWSLPVTFASAAVDLSARLRRSLPCPKPPSRDKRFSAIDRRLE